MGRFTRVDNGGQRPLSRGGRSSFQRVRQPTLQEKIRPESPLRPENEHLIGDIIEFNDVQNKYHLATIRGVVEAQPNNYEDRFRVEAFIRETFGTGPVDWGDVFRFSGGGFFGRRTKKVEQLARRERSRDYHGFFWVVTGMLERDMQVDLETEGGIYTHTHFLLQPSTFAHWVAHPAVAPDSF